jgi:putative transposase
MQDFSGLKTTEIFNQTGLVTYYILFFIHLETRQVHIAGVTPHPNEAWMQLDGPQPDDG